MIHFHRTSLMTSPAQTVVNTVNVVGVMGKGLAAAFKERYPVMFTEYKKICDDQQLQPGGLWLWKGSEQWVLNFATKKHWRNPSKMEYVRSGLQKFRETYEEMGIREVAFPRLGCGNGGLNWSEVRPLMLEALRDLPITIFIHDFEKKVGKLEHELPLIDYVRHPATFEQFCMDLQSVIKNRNGEVEPLLMKGLFHVELNKSCDLTSGVNGSEQLIAAQDDLFRIWNTLLTRSVSRFDLPDNVQVNALKVFSVLAQLPYVRPVNIADKNGRNVLAIEYMRSGSAESIAVNNH